METVTVKDLRNNYGALLDSVQNNKDAEVHVTRDGKPWVLLKSPLSCAPEKLNSLEKRGGREVRKNLALTLGMIHYQKKPILIVRKGVSSACVYPSEGN